MTRILVTGSKGQLGSEIQKIVLLHPEYHFILNDVDQLDICNKTELKQFFKNFPINYVINCAAYTAVDKAESEVEPAYKVNAVGPENLAKLSNEFGYRLIHISTDFVFDGEKSVPYKEDDAVNPLSVYGNSKLEGEKMLVANTSDYLIIRTSWLYSSFGNNFVKNMIRYGTEKGALRVVNDQTGSPTWAADLAGSILKIIKYSEENGFHSGIYHYSNEGAISWYEFARTTLQLAKVNCEITPIPTTEYPTPAKRPAYSVMDKNKIKKDFELYVPYWKDSLVSCIREMESSKYLPQRCKDAEI